MVKAETTFEVRHEPMRIAGRKVDADGVVNVHYPYTNAVIGRRGGPSTPARPSRSRPTTNRS